MMKAELLTPVDFFFPKKTQQAFKTFKLMEPHDKTFKWRWLSHLPTFFDDQDSDPDIEDELGRLILIPIAEDGDVGVEEEQWGEADAAAGVLDDRSPVEDVQLLEDAQLTTVVAEAGLENEFQAKLTE